MEEMEQWKKGGGGRKGAVAERMLFGETQEGSRTHPGSCKQVTHFEIAQDVKEHLVRQI